MQKNRFVLLFSFFLLLSCSIKKQAVILPIDLSNVIAYCEIYGFSKDRNFSGFVNFKLSYPHLYAEVSGPFGNTLMTLYKDGSNMRVLYTEKESDEVNGNLLSFPIDAMLEDIRLAGPYLKQETKIIVEKKEYKVSYDPTGKNPKICWENADGVICLSFLEVRELSQSNPQ